MITIYGDCGDGVEMQALTRVCPHIKGWTTNPSIAAKVLSRTGGVGVKDYETWARNLCFGWPSRALSFEVIGDTWAEMDRQARMITTWGKNVYVKIPITNTRGQSCCEVISKLVDDGIKVNVTAVMTYEQIDEVMDVLNETPAIVSVFAGRIADTGRNPVGAINHALKKRICTATKILWASPRQVLDVYTADGLGCDVITLTPDLIRKLPLEGKSLCEYSKETVKMFYDDAQAAGLTL